MNPIERLEWRATVGDDGDVPLHNPLYLGDGAFLREHERYVAVDR